MRPIKTRVCNFRSHMSNKDQKVKLLYCNYQSAKNSVVQSVTSFAACCVDAEVSVLYLLV